MVCCDDAYVYHYGEASFGAIDLIGEKRTANGRLLDQRWPEYMKDVYAFCCDNPFRELQERITAGIRELEGHALPPVLHVLHKFDSPGGTELHTRNIIDGLSSRFHSTVIYPTSIPDQWTDIAPGEETGHLRVLKLRKESANASDSFLGAQGDLSNAHVETVFSNFLRGGNPPIVHFQHLGDWGSLLLPLIAKHQGRKVVISLHDYYLLCPDYNLILPDLNRCGKIMADGEDAECIYCLGTKRHHQGSGKPGPLPDYLAERRLILKRVIEAADLLIAPSDFVRDRFIQAYGGEIRSRIVTVPHGIEPLQKIQPAKRKSILKVGFLGNASDRKGIFVLLLAAQILKKIKVAVQFEIFGGIPQTLSKLATDLGIVHHGIYRRTDLPRILSPINLVVMPSICEETFGFTLSESQMLGIPVLASDIGAISERIVEGKTGFLVPPNDAKALAAKLLELQRNPVLLEEVSANLRDCRLKTLEENVEDYARIYNRLIDDAACKPPAFHPVPGGPAPAEGRQVEELLALGEEQFSRGDMSSAAKIFQRILEIDVTSYKALNNLGVVQWQIGDAVSAIYAFQAALGFNPEDSDALGNLAKAVTETGRYNLLKPELLATLQQAQPANPNIARLIDGHSGC